MPGIMNQRDPIEATLLSFLLVVIASGDLALQMSLFVVEVLELKV